MDLSEMPGLAVAQDLARGILGGGGAAAKYVVPSGSACNLSAEGLCFDVDPRPAPKAGSSRPSDSAWENHWQWTKRGQRTSPA